ncbi:protein CopA/IncA [Escherichia coli]|uniref:protein CopA/IncA n=1 Tax=Escherichia TaxID=561 RepID=UPI0011301C80|nr:MULTISPECIES: protein CopA/IncA [Escherichia]EEZ9770062.1 protein CopA/IncA [Escherichia coli]EFC1703395.1 protein CopA/IncA [Escherichia coli]EFH7796860.1 protein CopA/IncA [Escherichia coli]EGI4626539.1 protein CopA/IncA [Escherichia coli]EGO7524128.1 protein CopA/IncA [Escherichia coli]
MWIYRSQKSENPDNPLQLWRVRKDYRGPIKPHSQQSSYVGSIVICPEKFKTSF